MARLRNVNSGAIVEVADEKVVRLGSEWVPVDDETIKKARSSRAKKAE